MWRSAEIEAILTMHDPGPSKRMAGWLPWATGMTSTAGDQAQCSRIRLNVAGTSAGVGQVSAGAVGPRAAISWWAAFSGPGLRAQIENDIPAAAKPSAVKRPIPSSRSCAFAGEIHDELSVKMGQCRC